jgi:hypothetical protein
MMGDENWHKRCRSKIINPGYLMVLKASELSVSYAVALP